MILEVVRKENKKQRRAGIRQGIKQGSIIIAKKLLARNMEIKDIEEITGLSTNEIEKLRV